MSINVNDTYIAGVGDFPNISLQVRSFPRYTSPIDTFTRTEDPLSSAWWSIWFPAYGNRALRADGSHCLPSTVNSGDGRMYWKQVAESKNCEARCTIITPPGSVVGSRSIYIGLRLDPFLLPDNANGYFVEIGNRLDIDYYCNLFRVDNGITMQIGSTVTGISLTATDFGVDMIDDLLTVYVKVGGTWISVNSTNDATYASPGCFGLALSDGVVVDDFIAGPLSAPSPVVSDQLSLQDIPSLQRSGTVAGLSVGVQDPSSASDVPAASLGGFGAPRLVQIQENVDPHDGVTVAGAGSGLVFGVPFWYFVSAVDQSGNESDESAGAVVVLQGSAANDTTPPGVPASITASSSVLIMQDGTVLVVLDIGWTGVPDTDLDYYDVELKRSGDTVWTIRSVPAGITGLRESGVVGATTYDLRVRSVDKSGNRSSFVLGSVTTVADTQPPGAPTELSATGGFQLVALSWVPPAEPDLDSIEVYRSQSNNSASAIKVGETRATIYVDSKLDNGVQFFYWIRARDFSGNLSPFNAGPTAGVSATTIVIGPNDVVTSALITQTAQISDAIITAAKIISLSADKITAGTIGAQLIKLGGDQIELDGANVYMRVLDRQSTPIERIRIGKLGGLPTDYGIQIAGTDGQPMWKADGLQVQGFGRSAGVQASQFAYYLKAVFNSNPYRGTWRTIAYGMPFTHLAGGWLEYDILFEDTDDPTLTIGAVDLACVERDTETAQAVGDATITFNAAAGTTVDQYKDMLVEIISNGTPSLNGQVVKVTAYTTGRVASIYPVGQPRYFIGPVRWPRGVPTGTVTYRVIRLLSVDGGVDQKGLSVTPSTMLGQRALKQWYTRVVPIPSSWDGKAIIGAAMAIFDVPIGVSETMLVKNVVSKSPSGESISLSMFGFTSMDEWAYGSDDNVTVTVRKETAGSMTSNETLMDGAVSRGTLSTATGIPMTAPIPWSGGAGIGSEAVIATFPQVAFFASSLDSLRAWIKYIVAFTPDTQQNQKFYFRLRLNNLTGLLVHEMQFSIIGTSASGNKGGPLVVQGSPAVNDFALVLPSIAGWTNLVLTAQVENLGPTSGPFSMYVNTLKIMTFARSA